MSIIFHKTSKTFHLYNNKISYIFMILRNGQLGQLYFGERIHDREDFGYLLEIQDRPMAACAYEENRSFSLEHIKQEYPSYGTGDMRYPAFTIAQENGSRISDFVYSGYHIFAGKPKLPGLPATYVEQEAEADSLEVYLEDELTDTRMTLRYSIFNDMALISRNVRFEQKGETSVTLERAMSLSIDLPDKNYEMIELTGAWSRERYIKSRKLEHGIQSVYSLRGCSSANYNPFIALKRPETTENSGEVIGFSLVYSGNFLAQTEVDTYDVTRVTLGIHPENFSWPLAKGESFETPEAVMVYSNNGLNGMSQIFHKLYQKRLARGTWRDRERPILINNWEATYFDFNEEKILQIAETAQKTGIELFVLDDGWFGKRNDDTSSLGDWYVNLEKLPNGIAGLAKKVEQLGIRFGLWIEPEMVNKDSDLYRNHPDWVLATPGRRMSHGRNQYVLDFSREEVVDGIFRQLEKIFADAPISYIKWDMNRSMTEVYSRAVSPKEQGMVMHKYILGVYRLYEKLIERFPEILFESCASGGSRFDPGMLYYAPQCWTSDDTDAIERLKIQYGTSLAYPISSMGAHVSAVPNHQLLRKTPLTTRGNVACFGAFGYELDITKMSEEEMEVIRCQVSFVKEYRSLLQYGTFYRLLSPFEGNVTAWMIVSRDQKKALVGYYRVLQHVNDAYHRIRLQGLNENFCYHVSILENEFYGDELMRAGLIVSDSSSGENHEKYDGTNGDYQSRIYELAAV
ncbi:MAG: alpha-galactosidase [Lachnospiraceae bacterium]|nr:alpha-galactosidase [Lachnospiraceae bacterium]